MTRAQIALGLAASLLASTLAAAPAHADDPRLVERLYSEDEVVRIAGRTNVQATICFGKDEQIENVAIGDSAACQVTPN
jgi:type IV secretion system protein VirB9